MEITVLDNNLDGVMLIEHAKVLWNEKYYECGEFELYFTDFEKELLNLIKTEYYISRTDTNEVGIIEDIIVNDSIEEGCTVTIKGRFLTSILDRRYILETVNLKGSIEDCIYKLINDNFINPVDNKRKISNFKLATKKNFPERITKQITGKNVYDVIQELCEGYGYGFRVILQDKNFVFEMYKGRDCSYNQTENTWLLFSEDYENLMSSMLEVNCSTSKTFCIVAGEGSGEERKKITLDNGFTGINRKELYVDARDLQSKSTDGGEPEMTESEYEETLINRGTEKLNALATEVLFQGDIDVTSLNYRTDFFLGDRVIVENNDWNINMFPQITEVLESYDENGYSVSPTFAGSDKR